MNPNITRISISVVMLSVAITSGLIAQPPSLHTPSEIIKIIEESELTYALDILTDYEPEDIESEQMLPGLTVVQTDEGPTLERIAPAPEVADVMREAQASFAGGEFALAAEKYLEVYASQPEYVHTLTLAGNSFFMLKQYDSARHYLRKAIELNYIDYQAHWFLSSTEGALDNRDEALHHLTVAHILNPGHPILKGALVELRKTVGQPWEEWAFLPACEISDEGDDGIRVAFEQGWMMYAITTAIWHYEPGYAESMGVEDLDNIALNPLPLKEAALVFMMEQEATMSAAESDDSEVSVNPDTFVLYDRLSGIVEAGMFELFVYYEVLGRQYPILFSSMDRSSIEAIAEYVSRFH